MTTPHVTGENPIILPTPVAVVHHRESKFSVLARFFAWLTAFALSVSVLVALVSVTTERNDLRTQLSCRAAASVEVNKAIINEQIALANHSVLVGEFITILIRTPSTEPGAAEIYEKIATKIDAVDIELDKIGDDLRAAVQQQAISLLSC